MFCKRCTREVTELLKRKYSIIEAAHFRAQLRHTARMLKQKMRVRGDAAAAGD